MESEHDWFLHLFVYYLVPVTVNNLQSYCWKTEFKIDMYSQYLFANKGTMACH